MEKDRLQGKRVAILVDNGFEEEELTRPRNALRELGAITKIVSPCKEPLKAWNHKEWGGEYEVDVSIDDADPADYDALLLPGGVINPDRLRRNPKAIKFAMHFFENDKTVAAICHGPQTLIEAGVVKGKKMTSFPSIRTDLENAGAHWVDEEVVQDGNLITSRNPHDIPAFNERIIQAIT